MIELGRRGNSITRNESARSHVADKRRSGMRSTWYVRLVIIGVLLVPPAVLAQSSGGGAGGGGAGGTGGGSGSSTGGTSSGSSSPSVGPSAVGSPTTGSLGTGSAGANGGQS